MKRLLFNNEKTAEFSGINILKIFSCLIVLLGHRLMYIGAHPLYNTSKFEEVGTFYPIALIY